ncbi:GGDEF domain-containing protein [Dokdonella sp.]|uniref:GGDEF domain-containing protein n=1 Tax=Dokdonella sp. TaxID=2291710 RepID=UPI00352971EB
MIELNIAPLDIPTLALSRSMMQVMLAGLLVYVGSQLEQRNGTRFWAAGLLLNGLALFIHATALPEPWYSVSTTFNHLAFGASSACFLLGFWKFGRQPRQLWLIVLMLAIPIISLIAWEWLWPNARWRVLTTASGQALYLLALQFSLGKSPTPDIARIYRRLRIIVVVYMLILIWSYASLADVLPTSARVSPGYHRTFFSVTSMLFMLSLAVGCLALQFALLAARNAQLAMVDWQTGLLNRRGFFLALGRTEELRNGRHAPFSAVVLDIDHFKQINDRHGHAAGDRVLHALGESLRALTRPTHFVARMGGEEFCIVLPGNTRQEATELAEAVRAACEQMLVRADDGEEIRFTLSAGVCEARPAETIDETLARADQALYAAKRDGRNRVASINTNEALPDSVSADSPHPRGDASR